jgi:Na+/H+-translocating membrane pyrophosphatase
MIPFIFSSLAIAAVGRAAMEMVTEVRRQFREIPGIMEYKAKPEYDKCVAISTKASIKEMMLPGAIALISPVVVGFAFWSRSSWRNASRYYSEWCVSWESFNLMLVELGIMPKNLLKKGL